MFTPPKRPKMFLGSSLSSSRFSPNEWSNGSDQCFLMEPISHKLRGPIQSRLYGSTDIVHELSTIFSYPKISRELGFETINEWFIVELLICLADFHPLIRLTMAQYVYDWFLIRSPSYHPKWKHIKKKTHRDWENERERDLGKPFWAFHCLGLEKEEGWGS